MNGLTLNEKSRHARLRGAVDRAIRRFATGFRRLSSAIMVAVGIATACGLGALWILYDIGQEATALAQVERTMTNLTGSVITGYETLMALGSAEIVQGYAARLKTVPEISDLRVLRVDGSEAFRDNRTISEVNSLLGTARFNARTREDSVPVLETASPELGRVVADGSPATYFGTDTAGNRTVTLLHPLLNAPICQGCHGGGSQIRGVLKLTLSLAEMDRAVRKTRTEALALVALALGLMLAMTYALIRVAVVRRVKGVADAMDAIVSGDYAARVPEQGRDELSDMARSFNRMVETVLASSGKACDEQSLTKALIDSAEDGILIADRDNDVVAVNHVAVRLLGKSAMRIMAEGLSGPLVRLAHSAAGERGKPETGVYVGDAGNALRVEMHRVRGDDQSVNWTVIRMRGESGGGSRV